MFLRIFFLFFLSPIFCFGQLLINEFSSKGSVKDFNGNNHDWIELINAGNTNVNLSNFYLSDNINNTSKWHLPQASLLPLQRVLILNSGSSSRKRVSHWESIINENTQLKYFLNSQNLDTSWNLVFNDSSWSVGVNGFGFGNNDDSTIIANTNSIYLRFKFNISNKSDIVKLLIHADYDDSFIAYLNGKEITRSKNIFFNDNYNIVTSEHNSVSVSGEDLEKYYFNKEQVDSLCIVGENIIAFEIHDFDSIPLDMSAKFFFHAGIHSDSSFFSNPSFWLSENESYYHSNFKLSEQEDIIVFDSIGNIVDQKKILSSNTFISEGRIPDASGNWCYISSPSPDSSNNNSVCFNGVTTIPQISLNSGFYNTPQYVTINSSNTEVYYTINGDVPDTNDFLYSDTLFLDSTTVLSFRSYKSSLIASSVVDRTYIINEDNYGLPVFSIITDSLNLWDWNNGIYVLGANGDTTFPYYNANWRQGWSKWSRLEYFDKNKINQAYEEFELKIHGRFSTVYPQKSFRLDFKSIYSGDLEVPIISQKSHVLNYNNINLRNGGQNNNKSKLLDGFFSMLADKTNIDVMGYEPCILYLNGVYWGVYNIREKMDEYYVESNHNLNKDSIDLINANSVYPKIYSGSDLHFINLQHQLLNMDHYSFSFFEILEEGFDIENMIDYFIFELYIGNRDWLGYHGNNIKLWKPQSENAKWRFMLYDTDNSFKTGFGANFDCITYSLNGTNADSKLSKLLEKCMKNPEFKCRFGNRYTDLINTIFHPDYFDKVLDSLKIEIEDAMPKHINKWKRPFLNTFIGDFSNSLDSIEDWKYYIDDIKDYNISRRSFAINHLENYFNLFPSFFIGLNVVPNNSGKIKINSIIPETYPWKETFLSNSCSNTFIALADSGYVFDYWDIDYIIPFKMYNDTIDLFISDEMDVNAFFRPCLVNNIFVNIEDNSNYFFTEFDYEYGPYSYQWFLNNDTILNAEDSVFYPKISGYYNVSVTDKDGCFKFSDSLFFNCDTLINAHLTQDTIDNSLNVNVTGSKNPNEYSWFYNGDLITSLYDSIHYPSLSGYYLFSVKDNNGCQSVSDSIFAINCGINIDVELVQDSIFDDLKINYKGGTIPYTFEWFLDSFLIDNVEGKSFLRVSDNGNYFAIVKDYNGCAAITNEIIARNIKINIFPNPSSEILNIEFLKIANTKYTISILDLNMNSLYSVQLSEANINTIYTHSLKLELSNFGIYFLRLEVLNKNTQSFKQLSQRFIYKK